MTKSIFRNSNFDQPRDKICLLHTCNWFEKRIRCFADFTIFRRIRFPNRYKGKPIYVTYNYVEIWTDLSYIGFKIQSLWTRWGISRLRSWLSHVTQFVTKVKSHFIILVTDKCNERDNCSKLEVFKFLVGNNIFVRNHSRNFHFLFLWDR